MPRKTFIQIDGVLYDKSEPLPPEAAAKLPSGQRFPSIFPDLPDFVSPIDGKTYSGRAGLRDHCARHNVVPTADLKGLPVRSMNQQLTPDRAGIREAIRRQIEK
jgi:hypothetical protein